MSRLYGTLGTDMRRKSVPTIRGRQYLEAQINYGSAAESKLAVKVIVSWHPSTKKPLVTIEFGDVALNPTIHERASS